MKSKQYRTLWTDENGIDYIFDQHAFVSALLEYTENNNCSKSQAYRDLEKEYYVSPATVKKWWEGKNGPGDLEIVKKMGEFFHCNLLTQRDVTRAQLTEGSVYSMNMEQNSFNINRESFLESSQKIFEIDAAKEAYSILSDLICSERELLLCFWHEVSENGPNILISGEFKQSSKHFPVHYPTFGKVYRELSKLRFSLPHNIHNDAMRLARLVYGHWSAESDTLAAEGFINMHAIIDDYNSSEYSKQGWDEDFFEWCAYVNDSIDDYTSYLDSVFQKYLPH